MKIDQPTRTKRLIDWLKRHKIPVIIISSVILLLAAAVIILFVFIFPSQNQNNQSSDTPADTTPSPPPPKYYSLLSGLEIQSEAQNTSPTTCIMIENSPSARPHSGLADASVVYEAIAEGGITRFLTVWQNAQTALIGPVRSLRPYYLEWAAPYDCAIAHVGGSEDALAAVRNPRNGYRDIDQFFNSSYYWRATDRYAPHNVYTSSALMATANEQKSYATSAPAVLPRSRDLQPAATPTATTISLKISTPNYNPIYTYDAGTNTYLRAYQQDNTPHMSTTTCATELEHPQVKDCEAQQLAPSVVIGMLVSQHTTYESSGYARQDITTTGTGTAHIFQGGQHIEATWSRLSITEQLIFTDPAGTPISFAPGQIWISAIPTTSGSVTWQ